MICPRRRPDRSGIAIPPDNACGRIADRDCIIKPSRSPGSKAAYRAPENVPVPAAPAVSTACAVSAQRDDPSGPGPSRTDSVRAATVDRSARNDRPRSCNNSNAASSNGSPNSATVSSLNASSGRKKALPRPRQRPRRRSAVAVPEGSNLAGRAEPPHELVVRASGTAADRPCPELDAVPSGRQLSRGATALAGQARRTCTGTPGNGPPPSASPRAGGTTDGPGDRRAGPGPRPRPPPRTRSRRDWSTGRRNWWAGTARSSSVPRLHIHRPLTPLDQLPAPVQHLRHRITSRLVPALTANCQSWDNNVAFCGSRVQVARSRGVQPDPDGRRHAQVRRILDQVPHLRIVEETHLDTVRTRKRHRTLRTGHHLRRHPQDTEHPVRVGRQISGTVSPPLNINCRNRIRNGSGSSTACSSLTVSRAVRPR